MSKKAFSEEINQLKTSNPIEINKIEPVADISSTDEIIRNQNIDSIKILEEVELLNDLVEVSGNQEELNAA